MAKEKEVWIDCTKEDLEERAIRYNATGIIGQSKKGIKCFPENFAEATIKDRVDVKKVAEYRDKVPYVVVNSPNWEIIPLEYILGEFQKSSTKIAVRTNDAGKLETLKGVIEMGVDAFIVDNPDSIEDFCKALKPSLELKLDYAEVTEVREVEMGKRVCVNTIMSFKPEEGILVGCMPYFMFLADAETKSNPFINTRDWRVNAGAACHYTLVPSNDPQKPSFGPKYLDDLKSGERVMAIDSNGKTRLVHVAATKTEYRPLTLIKAKYGDLEGTVYQQTAETVRLVSENSSIRVDKLKIGDKLKVYISKPEDSATHLGQHIEEFVSEK
jgi:3-dehydroquinate synthase II